MTTKPTTISMFTYKIAAGVIIAAIIGLTSLGFSTIENKVDKDIYDEHCRQTLERFEALDNRIDQQVKINGELLKTLNRMEVKLERVETNTEWLIKEVKK